ncbi:probable small nuclear ribonucleoprotein D1 (nucleomorph) [Guillardia theta]|uniref:Probable small nuclear ribonucleoprotein D1 n=1 Tax=Guillardia theta TaxID=55529 RepID=Q98S70_GUITH|nr:probable small nuclear ribonucleoprotein D1 [Guillardia theta]AAK39798.1 probable small nuclear ribonucleoprotein D1 [Guillardia theta]
MKIYNFIKQLKGEEIIIELKNNIIIMGVIVNVDKNMNLKVSNISDIDIDGQKFFKGNLSIRFNNIRIMVLPSKIELR